MAIVIEIVEYETDKVVKTVEVGGSMSKAYRVDDGININLNHEKFYTRILGITTKENQP